jgi:hypothetical protein
MSRASFKLLLRAFSGAAGIAASYSLADAALVGAGVSAAGASIAFAGLMLARDERGPQVNGLEYLAIFSQPSGGARRESAPALDARRVAAAEIDMSPTGSIATDAQDSAAPDDGYHLVSGRPDLAWLRKGLTIRAVRPGDNIAGLGTIGSIIQRGGEWLLLDEAGGPLIVSDRSDGGKHPSGASRFSKGLIFDQGAR